jgi:hypothetical protein
VGASIKADGDPALTSVGRLFTTVCGISNTSPAFSRGGSFLPTANPGNLSPNGFAKRRRVKENLLTAAVEVGVIAWPDQG